MKLVRPGGVVSGAALLAIVLFFLIAPRIPIRGLLFYGVILGIIVIWLVILLIMRIRAAKASQALEKSLEEQANQQIASSRPDKEAEIQDLNRRLMQAIEALKQSRVGKSHGKGALYALPWYMIIGPPASGKTTLLRKSGLNFPYADPDGEETALKGVGGTRNCDWWFASEAVILDTAGRYTLSADEDDTKEWTSFLDLLKRHRGKKPINGLVAAVSIQELLKSDEEAEKHGRLVRARVDEVISRLGISFPIYVTFTKCDLVRGFIEYFGDLSRNERAHVWGATIARQRASVEPAAQIFQAEMGKLVASLQQSRILRLSQGLRREGRPEVLFFPLQFKALERRLAIFIRTLFRENPYQESPIFRGFYFTSGTQEGRPIDQVINAMLSGFGLTSQEQRDVVEETQTKSYFIEKVFSHVMFPDRHLAGPSADADRRRRRRRSLLFAFGAAATVVLFGALWILLSINNSALNSAQKTSENIVSIAEARATLKLSDVKELDKLRRALIDMDRRDAAKAAFLWTYRGEPTARQAKRLYIQVVHDGVMNPATNELEFRLSQNRDSLQVSFVDFFYTYKTWLVLKSPNEFEKLPADELGRIAQSLAVYWGPKSVPSDRDWSREEWNVLLEDQLRYLHKDRGLYSDLFATDDPFEDARAKNLKRSIEQTLNRYWRSEQIYPHLQHANAAAPEPVQELGLEDYPEIDRWMTSLAAVPGMYTDKGWEQPVGGFLNTLEEIRSDLNMKVIFEDDVPRIHPGIVRLYGQDYVRYWTEFLRGVQRRSDLDADAVQTFLEASSEPDSPIIEILRLVDRNTRLDNPDPDLSELQDQAFGAVHEFFQKPLPMVKWRLWRPRNDEGSREYYLDYLEKVDKLASVYPDLPDPRRSKEYSDLQSWIGLNLPSASSDPVAAEVARILGMPLVAGQVHRVNERAQAIQGAWASVYNEYKDNLEGFYPLADNSRAVSLGDFESFFSPGGTFWKFYDGNLADVVSESGEVLDPTVGLSGSFLAALNKAYMIKRALFSSGDEARLEFSIANERPRGHEGTNVALRTITFSLGGKNYTYDMGKKIVWSVSWPGESRESGAGLAADAARGASFAGRRFDGAWGFFRLLDEARITPGESSEGQVVLTWALAGGDVSVEIPYDVRGLPRHHPLKANFLRFSCPRSVIGS